MKSFEIFQKKLSSVPEIWFFFYRLYFSL